MIKSENFRYFSIKSYVVDAIYRGDSNTHPKHMILWRTYHIYGKNTVFCENFMSTETFT